ncbi:hypothetical protein C8A00DRAFT_46977 [Chaetomidium leptoderma]|uniref:Uncharacterized protein n=1 Tax=Chaetomidium leptoderma TaxID=669021 RepID=A0AAN6VDK4_9PEZI|nr:hypothetical protein C8A00DRAFT_46977 [Chaetomidium leptoderma]
MSSTTTTQTQTRTQQNVLRDYEVHHSASSTRATGPLSQTATAPRPQAEAPLNPPDWDTTHRRVPLYRPIDRDRDQSEIRVYNNNIEQVFVGTMFTGVLINATTAKLWRGTVGRLNEGLFKYAIGGEI